VILNRGVRGPWWAILLLAFLLVPLLGACAGEGEGTRAAEGTPLGAPASDSLVEAILGGREASPVPPPTSPRLSPQEQAAQTIGISEMGYDEGSPSAPVKVLELSDFGCGYCRIFHQQTFPTLRRVYIEAGLVEWKHIPYVLGIFPNGLQAATAAECAGEQDGFFPMHRALYDSQAEWRSSQDPNQFFSNLAARLELDVERFGACFAGGWREGRLRANARLGQQVGVRGTPSFLIDGQLLPGAIPLEDFRDVLDAALRLKGVTPPPR
jgi:protein-disulfide isomerase